MIMRINWIKIIVLLTTTCSNKYDDHVGHDEHCDDDDVENDSDLKDGGESSSNENIRYQAMDMIKKDTRVHRLYKDDDEEDKDDEEEDKDYDDEVDDD